MSLRFRKEGELPQCSVVGCPEYPPKKLYGREFCEAHAHELTVVIGERIEQEFARSLKQSHVDSDLCFYDDVGFAWVDLKCSVQSCGRRARGGSDIFAKLRNPGWLYLCEEHNQILQDVFKRDLGSKLIWEWTQRRKVRGNGAREKRIKAIHESATKHQGKPNYIEKVCVDLRERRIKMLAAWLEKWETKYALRFEPTDWPVAYKDPRCRHTIERHISRYR